MIKEILNKLLKTNNYLNNAFSNKSIKSTNKFTKINKREIRVIFDMYTES